MWSLTMGPEQDDRAHARLFQPASVHGSAQSRLISKHLAPLHVL